MIFMHIKKNRENTYWKRNLNFIKANSTARIEHNNQNIFHYGISFRVGI